MRLERTAKAWGFKSLLAHQGVYMISQHSKPLPTDPSYDGFLAKTNVEKTLEILQNGGWYTVQQLAPLIHATETATSSALRDLRKPKYGQYNIFRRRLPLNISEYKLFERGYKPSEEELT